MENNQRKANSTDEFKQPIKPNFKFKHSTTKRLEKANLNLFDSQNQAKDKSPSALSLRSPCLSTYSSQRGGLSGVGSPTMSSLSAASSLMNQECTAIF